MDRSLDAVAEDADATGAESTAGSAVAGQGADPGGADVPRSRRSDDVTESLGHLVGRAGGRFWKVEIAAQIGDEHQHKVPTGVATCESVV